MSCEALLEDVHAEPANGIAPWPQEMHIRNVSRTLEMTWQDMQATLSHKVLRQSCRCSACESTRRKLDDVIPVASDVALLKMEMLGTIGVQLFFSDGHERGIYPWTYLRQIALGPAETGYTEALMKGWSDE